MTAGEAHDALVRMLAARRDLGGWSARTRDIARAEAAQGGSSGSRTVRRAELAARVHVDGPTGRGTADVAVDAADPAAARLDEAVARAAVSFGPGWRAAPPGAPARVRVADRAFDDPEAVAAALVAAAIAAADAAEVELVEARAVIEVAAVAVSTSGGLADRWLETLAEVEVVVADRGHAAALRRVARRAAELDPARLVADAAGRARARAAAVATPLGPRAVLVGAELLGGDGAAILAPLAALADATLHRQGLARARVGAPVVPGADAADQPLDVTSDGTLAWALATAPLGDHGEPVRRFPIVERGRVVGLGLDEREAALRGEPANGGVRNLVTPGGDVAPAALRGDGVLELVELTWTDVEPLTGRGALGIGLALLHQAGIDPQPVRGGEVQGDLLAALARSRRGGGAAQVGAYAGAALIRLDGLVVT